MAIVVKYVVVSNGNEDMIFSTRNEAEAHDKMLAIAERLSAFLQAAEVTMTDETLEALTIFMDQHRADLGTILKGGRLQTPTVRTQLAAGPQDTRAEASSSAPKRSKASPSAPPAQPQAAA